MGDLELDVVPHERLGPVRLGMTAEEVEVAVGEAPESFDRGGLVHGFLDCALQVTYDDRERVNFVEVSSSLSDAVTWEGRKLLALSACRALRALRRRTAVTLTEGGTSAEALALDLALWREDPGDKRFLTLAIGVRGYFAQRDKA